MHLFQLGDFVLSSGATSRFKIDCDALTDGDWATLAQMVRQLVGPFRSVEGIPRGGLPMARRLEQYVSLEGPHLIVDDVLTTGGSLERAKTEYKAERLSKSSLNNHVVVGVVVFARCQRPPWVKALFEMPEVFWIVPRHR